MLAKSEYGQQQDLDRLKDELGKQGEELADANNQQSEREADASSQRLDQLKSLLD